MLDPATLLAVLAVAAVAVAALLGYRRTARGAKAVESVDLKRLEQIASVPMADIIAAAEYRAEHPDESEPAVLRDLDPSAWRPRPSPRQVASTRPPQELRLAPQDMCSRTLAVIEGEMTFTRFSTAGDGQRVEWGVNGIQGYRSDNTQQFNVPIRSTFADCDHEGAEHEEIRAYGSPTPVRRTVVACEECELAALRQQAREYHELTGVLLVAKGTEISAADAAEIRKRFAITEHHKTQIYAAEDRKHQREQMRSQAVTPRRDTP